MDDLFDKVLHYYGRKAEKLFMINIGAMDGEMFDTLTGYSNMYGSDVLYVEPIKKHFERLKENKSCHSGNLFENAAISDYNGTVSMKTIPVEIVDQGLVHHAFYGMSVIDPSKNGMGSEADREVVEKYAIDVEVNCITFQTLIDKHQIESFDVLYMDTEGHDHTIFKQVDLQKFRPKLIRLEYCNLSDEEKELVKKKFTDNGYIYEISGGVDIDGLRQDVYDEILQSLPPEAMTTNGIAQQTNNTSSTTTNEIDSKITVVTGLWNIKRGELVEGWSRSFEHYLEKFNELLDLPHNLIVFGEKELEGIIFKKRSKENTQFIVRSQDWFKNEFYDKIQKIRNSEDWKSQAGWLRESTQSRLDMYNPLVMSKPFLLNDARSLDQFDSTHLYWLDAGITNTVHPGYFTHDKVLGKLADVNCISFLAFPYEANNEIHGFDYKRLCELAGDKVNKVCRGGFFGGPKSDIAEFNGNYYQLLSSTLSEGYMGTEESLFSIMLYKYPYNYQYALIEENGLISTFFEAVKNDNHTFLIQENASKKTNNLNVNNTALYVITFNSPNQVKALIKSMLSYDKDFVEKPKWIMLDNSSDLSTTIEYKKICAEHDILHIKKDNLGICGGRQFIAEHAEENGFDYYFFFEDDMFFYPKEGEVCKNGFNRYVGNLYKKSLQIIKRNNFDFLKLSFTEFFGDNKTQWAWYNVPQSFREKHWPEKSQLPTEGLDPDAPQTVFKNIGMHEGIPFADGEIYYCNWPQVVSKIGNKKMFLKEKWANPFEQTWMSFMYQETIQGNLYPGILLLSPTEHDRFEHYDGSLRKESGN